MQYFKSFSREKSTQDEKGCLIKGNDLKVAQVELLSFFIFKGLIFGLHTMLRIYKSQNKDGYILMLVKYSI